MADHDATVVREAGMYWVRCTACGIVAKSQTQKAVMQSRADAHNGGATVAQPRATKGMVNTKTIDDAIREQRAKKALLIDKALAPGSAVAQAPVLGAKSQALRTNTCQGCGGTLRAGDGHMHETLYPTKFVCCDCRALTLKPKHVLWCKGA